MLYEKINSELSIFDVSLYQEHSLLQQVPNVHTAMREHGPPQSELLLTPFASLAIQVHAHKVYYSYHVSNEEF
jgi:hypothetical protein